MIPRQLQPGGTQVELALCSRFSLLVLLCWRFAVHVALSADPEHAGKCVTLSLLSNRKPQLRVYVLYVRILFKTMNP